MQPCPCLPDPCGCTGIGDRPNGYFRVDKLNLRRRNVFGRLPDGRLLGVVHRWEDFEQVRQLGSGEGGPD
jgi:hypothetical protein